TKSNSDIVTHRGWALAIDRTHQAQVFDGVKLANLKRFRGRDPLQTTVFPERVPPSGGRVREYCSNS
ncbi:MAG: hypothetical protein AABX47_02940, partial [Nanoarchaeota archaeon]